jgi:predicted RNA binding protein YcfA (HicA-like mRNA interferase family)
MSMLPRISGRDTVKLLAQIGYQKDRPTGSHIV